jgi:hypothetical protein
MYVETTGKDSKGHFNTAPLKEYPPGLCKAIAIAQSFGTEFCTASACMDYSARPELPISFYNLCTKMRDNDFGKFIGLD